MSQNSLNLVLFGGSSGSMTMFEDVLRLIKSPVSCTLVFVLHRGKTSTAFLPSLFKSRTEVFMDEPGHLDEIKTGSIYFAIPDYHLLIGQDRRFYYDCSDKDFFSRPSIDATFTTAALSGIPVKAALLFSGSSADGAFGIKTIAERGYTTYVLNPGDAESPRMPAEALALCDKHKVLFKKDFTKTVNDILYSGSE